MNLLKLVTKKHLLFAILAMGCSGYSQKTIAEYKALYPDYNELILKNAQSYNVSIEDKKLKVIQDNHYEAMILTANGIQNNKENFSYSSLVQLKSYDAYAVLNDNGKEKKLKVTQTNEKLAQDGSIFYNDVKTRELLYNNLEAGSKKVYKYQTEFLDPFLLHKFIFGNHLPTENNVLEITTDKNIEIGFKVFNDPNNNVAFTKTEKKGKWLYTWQLRNTKPFKFEENAPGYLYVVPHINFFIKNYRIDNLEVPVLGDVPKLYNYYKAFLENLNTTNDEKLQKLALDITKDKTTEEEKVKAIFYWVKDNVKYIAFENGYDGFIPRQASLILDRKFGDCKDMGSFISCLANYANIKNVAIAWIGTRTIPYTYQELSTPAVDNHMIAVYEKNGVYYFLDATDKETKYGLPTAFIQGKEAMLHTNQGHKIIQVPIVNGAENRVSDVVQLQINNAKLIGSGAMELHGYNRSHTLMQMGDASNKTKIEAIKSIVLKGNNKFKLLNFNEKNQENRDAAYQIDYSFELDNYCVKIDNEIYVNLFLNKFLEEVSIEESRESTYELEFLSLFSTSYQLKIPSDYKVKSLPDDFVLQNDFFDASFTYKQNSQDITLQLHLEQKKIRIEKSEFKAFNESLKQIQANYNKALILSKK